MDENDEQERPNEPGDKPEPKPVTDARPDLIEGIRRGDESAFAALLGELRPRFLHMLCQEFAHVSDGHAQILEQAEVTLTRWAADVERPELLPPGQSMWVLAKRLLLQEKKVWTRAQEYERKAVRQIRKDARHAGPSDEGSPEEQLLAEGLVRQLAALPEPHKSTLQAEADRVLEGGSRTLAQRLGISDEVARKRLSRARAELQKRLYGDGK